MIDKWLSGWPGWTLYQLICVGFLGFGLVRLGAGSAALMQMAGWVEFAEITEALVDVEKFMAEHADQSFYAFGVADYFAYIAAMGLVLTIGTIGAMRYKLHGLKIMGVYLAMHAALFVNAMVLNPKVILLAVTATLVGVLVWLRPRFANG